MGKQLFRSLWACKRRLFGAGMAVVIGVAFLAATMILGDGMRAGIHSLFEEGNSGTDALVRGDTSLGSLDAGDRANLDISMVDTVAAAPGVELALPRIEAIAQIEDADGNLVGGDGPPTLGVNWVGYPRNPYDIIEGRPPAGPGEVVLDSGTAKTAKLDVGDTTTVRVPQPVDVEVVGIAELGSGASMGGVTFTWFDTATAQELLLGSMNEISSVNVTAQPGVSQDQVVASISQILPGGVEAISGAALTAEDDADIASDFLDFFEVFLLAFAGVALLVATFTIHNTLSIVVAQRTRESALLRALGASRRQVLVSVVVEALAIGVIAAGVGLAAGYGLARGLDAMLSAMGFGIPTGTLAIDMQTAIVAMLVGIVVTLIASVTPAIKASRVAPLAALRELDIDRSGRSIVRGVIGTLVTVSGIMMVINAPDQGDSAMSRAGLGALLTLVGVVMVGPVVAKTASSVIGRIASVFGGQSGRLARRNSMRNPKRTAGTASALMLGTAVVALFATFGASIKQSLDDLLADAYEGDFVVVQEGFSGAGLAPELATEIGALPEVRTSTGMAFASVTMNGDEQEPLAIEPAPTANVIDLDVTGGSLAEMSVNGLAVSQSFADDEGWKLGTPVEVGYADGSVDEMTVEVIFGDANMLGDTLINKDAWTPHAQRAEDFIVAIGLADGVSVDDGRTAIDAVTQTLEAPLAQDRDEYLATASEELDAMLGLVYGLLGLAILIALLGIANTLSLSLYERTRELGLLRAVGQTRRQLKRTVRWESVIVAVFGTIGGLALGTFLGWGMMQAIKASEGFGSFVAPLPTLAVVLGVAVVAGVVAAIRPARRAAKLDVLEAIASH